MKSLIISIILSFMSLSVNAMGRDSLSIADSLLYLDASPTENVKVDSAVMSDTTVAYTVGANIGRN